MFSPKHSTSLRRNDEQDSIRKPSMMDRVKYKLFAKRDGDRGGCPGKDKAESTEVKKNLCQSDVEADDGTCSNNEDSHPEKRSPTELEPFDQEGGVEDLQFRVKKEEVESHAPQSPEYSESEVSSEAEAGLKEVVMEGEEDERLNVDALAQELVLIGRSPLSKDIFSSTDAMDTGEEKQAAHKTPCPSTRTTETISSSPKKKEARTINSGEEEKFCSQMDAPIRAHTKKQAMPEDVPILASASILASSNSTITLPNGTSNIELDPAAAITQVFGEKIARMIGADSWQERQDVFDAIQYSILKSHAMKDAQAQFCALLAAVQCGLEDRVAPVMYCALECFFVVVDALDPALDCIRSKNSVPDQAVASFIKAVIARTGDNNKRTKREAQQALLKLIDMKNFDISSLLLPTLISMDISKRVQVGVLLSLVQNAKNEKLLDSIKDITKIAVSSLSAADDKTRKAALELVAQLFFRRKECVSMYAASLKSDFARHISQRMEELVEAAKADKQDLLPEKDSLSTSFGGAELVEVSSQDDPSTISLLQTQLQIAQNNIGPVIWRKLESKIWSDRKEAFTDIEKLITRATTTSTSRISDQTQQEFSTYCVCVHAYLTDSISPVVNAAMDCFLSLVKSYGAHVDFRDNMIRDVLIQVILRLCPVIHKNNTRTSRAASRCIIKLTRIPYNNVHPLRYILSCIFKSEMEPVSQMHLLRLLIPEFGFEPDGIDPNRVIACVVNALVHGNEKERKIAMDVAVCTQRLMGSEFVLNQAKNVKGSTYKELKRIFEEAESIRAENGSRPQTVHFHLAGPANSLSTEQSTIAIPKPPSQERPEGSRRVLHSAPVGSGSLQCSAAVKEYEHAQSFGVLSCEEENMMDSILKML